MRSFFTKIGLRSEKIKVKSEKLFTLHSSLFTVLIVTIIATPLSGHAQTLPPANSPYVQQIIERSNKGIAYAWSLEGVMRFSPFMYAGWMRTVTGTISRFVDTDIRIIQERQNLLSDSACLRADEIILELQMNYVREQLKMALNNQSIIAIFELQNVLEFLNKRYTELLRGAKDPTYVDSQWYTRWSFEPKQENMWCCPQGTPGNTCAVQTEQSCSNDGGQAFATLDQCTGYGCLPPAETRLEPPMCPFHSDYLPPSLNGYGCDVEALTKVVASMPPSPFIDATKKELAALAVIQAAIEQTSIAGDIVGGGGGAQKRVHLFRYGCIQDGRCESEIQKQCSASKDCPGESRCIDALTIGQCDREPTRQCFENKDCGAGSCQRLSEAMQIELRGPFSLTKNHQGLLEAFRLQRQRDGVPRPQSQALLEGNNRGILLDMLARYGRSWFSQFNPIQGEKETVAFAVGSDPLLQTSAAYDSLNTSVAELSRLASEMTGIRGFVRDFAWFLRRSCLERPCNLRLDRILKLVFKNECFPYVSGEYLKDTEQDTRWKKCLDAAGIQPLR